MYYLVSPAGIPNYGDELIAMTWLRHLAEVVPQAEIVVDCLGPQAAAARMGHLHPGVRFAGDLWNLCTTNWSTDPEATASAVAAAGLSFLRDAEVVHVLGGGFVNRLWAPFAGLLAGVVAATRESGARTAMTGQGLWPPAGDLVRTLAEQFDVVDVRDAPSRDFLGVGELSADDVFLGVGPHLWAAGPDAPDVMVSVQTLVSTVDPDKLVRFVAEVLAEWGVGSVGLVECAPDQDIDVLAMPARRLPVARTYRLDELLADGLPARPGQCWLTTRFHPHLVAAAAGASGVAMPIEPDYYATKHRSLAGSSWHVLDELVVPSRPTSGGYPPEELERLRQAKLRVAERIYPARP